MARLRCTVSEGLRKAEASITVKDHSDVSEYFPLDRGLIAHEDGVDTIPVSFLQYSDDEKFALISLPVEADSGSRRIWVKAEDLNILEPAH